MNLRWQRDSTADLVRIREFIAKQNAEAGEKVRLRIIETVEHLRLFPNLGRAGRRAGTHELVVGGLPYIVVYRIDDHIDREELVILAIFHAAQDR